MNYYEILGLSKNEASEENIKKAFKKLALKHHPDKGGDPEEFKKINLAYSVLSDPQKKREYDNPQDNLHHAFNNFFNFNFHQQQQQLKCKDYFHELKITLKEIYTGTKKTIKVKINKTCFDCQKECTNCKGKGVIIQIQQLGFMQINQQITCNECMGSGNKNNKNIQCEKCNGTNNIIEECNCIVEINKETQNNQFIKFEGLGEQKKKKNDISGDLIIKIIVEKDLHFERQENNLIFIQKITLIESIIGKDITIPHFENNININTSIFGIINPNKNYIIKNKGLTENSNLIIKFEIEYPEKMLESNQREYLKNILSNIL